MFFTARPKHPFAERPVMPPYVYTIASKQRKNKRGEPYGIGKLAYQPSRNRFVVICYDPECDKYFASVSK